MLISERIFEKLTEKGMTQKEFSYRTGIRETTISEWKKRGTNPSADKIMIICNVLGVTPEWLLSGTEVKKGRQRNVDWYVIDRNSDMGILIGKISDMSEEQKSHVMKYVARMKKNIDK